MTAVVFWLASFLVIYPYLVYPVLLRLLARRAEGQQPADDREPPFVTLIVSAYNEEAVIGAKLENATALAYPAERLEILVVSDASSDQTDEIVRQAAAKDSRIRLLRQNERRGKSAGLNNAVEMAKGEVVVFSDANAMYDSNALRELTRYFADPRVGYVVGAALYYDPNGSRAAESEGLYWKLEMALKQLESDYDSVVGGDGAIYAARRQLFRPLQDDDISDFVNPIQIVAAGYRGRFNRRAFCYEGAGESFSKEFGRKRRIVNRSWRAVRRYGRLLSLRRQPRFVFMLVSHKVIRWFALPLVAVAWAANALLLGTGALYVVTGSAITGSFLLAGWGAVLDRRGRPQPRLVATAYYFYLVNLAAVLGMWDEFRGVRHATWDHIRKQST